MRNILLLVLLVGLCFSPCLKADFVNWDDDHHVFDNPLVKTASFSNIFSIFQTAVNKTYIPLTTLSFNIEHFFFGLDPFVFHLNNLLLHILICLLIYQLFCRMGFDSMTAFLAALLFGIHPMHVESVAWITQRKDLLYSLFYLISMISYWDHLIKQRQLSYLSSIFFALLSILSKPMALSLPLTLLILDWYYHGRLNKKAVFKKIPHLIFILPIAWITYSLNARVPFGNPLESFLIWTWSATFYIKKLLTPFVLIPLYQLPQPLNPLNPSYASSLFILAALPFVILALRRDRLFIFASTFYALSTFFLWRYDNTVDITIVGDRFMYLPSLGICLWLAHKASEHLKRNNFLPKAFIAVIVGLLAFQTFQQCRIWQNDLSLWGHQLKHEQRVPLAYNSYAVALSKMKDDTGALKALDEAIKLKPDYARAYYNRGHIYVRYGRYEEALKDLDSAILYDPIHFGALLDRGTTYGRLGKYPEALRDLNRAAALEPNNSEVFNNRGIVHRKSEQLQNALDDLNRALELNPRSASSYINRAKVWEELGKQDEALNDLKEAERLGMTVRE